MDASIVAPLMFACLVLVLLAGFPVAFSLAAVAGAFGILGVATGAFEAQFLTAMIYRLLGVFQNDNFLAIPMFVFMGILLERTGMAEEMLTGLNTVFGQLPGGLAYTTILVGSLLSAITGFVSASVIAMGLIALPVMLRAGYDPRLATGVVAATGTLAQIVPPSLVLIVLAEQLEVSLVDIYRGALVPSLLMVGLYALYVFVMTLYRPSFGPPLQSTPTQARQRGALETVLRSSAPPLAVILGVLASVYFGVATPTEGGAVGVVGILILAVVRRRLKLRPLLQAMDTTGILCSSVIFLLLGASFFTLVFRGLDGQVWVEAAFARLPGGELQFLLLLNLGIFLLAFFLDFFEIAFIVLPLVAPVARKMGIDMTWLAVLLAVNLQTSFMHPPFGIAIYNVRSVAPRSVATSQIYWGAIPFLLIQLSMVALLIAAPSLVRKAAPVLIDPANIIIDLPGPQSEEEPLPPQGKP